MEEAVKRFSKYFLVGDQTITARFEPVNTKVKRLYQVYLLLPGKEVRIHIQADAKGCFYITDPHRLPSAYEAIAESLIAAVEQA
ncbi:hypothetical protein [Chitinophaga rhizosphaerae]|uniref:hypothetical protein n=1 Tax=Chitinophaga rhizosphaerae TaxID=1864947 RepID=UPI0013DF88C8|nr:hypothetical protein [Chitinophaga rhizosphaerae]